MSHPDLRRQSDRYFWVSWEATASKWNWLPLTAHPAVLSWHQLDTSASGHPIVLAHMNCKDEADVEVVICDAWGYRPERMIFKREVLHSWVPWSCEVVQ